MRYQILFGLFLNQFGAKWNISEHFIFSRKGHDPSITLLGCHKKDLLEMCYRLKAKGTTIFD